LFYKVTMDEIINILKKFNFSIIRQTNFFGVPIIKATSKNKYLSNENMLEYLKLLFTDFNYELNGNNLFISK
jgi:hypothetical protein